jgi:hypothetical protein
MPVLRFPHIPTGFTSGGRLTTRVGLSDPSTYQRHPLSPRPCGLCLSLSRALGTQLAVIPRDSSLFYHRHAETERRSGAFSPA